MTETEPVQLDIRGGSIRLDASDLPTVRGLALYVGSTGYAYYSLPYQGRSGAHAATLHSLLIGSLKGHHADHINGDKLDNRRANLRLVPIMLNHANRHVLNRNNTSGHRGVVFAARSSASRPWRAQIGVDRKGISIGYFATKDEAIEARRAAELHYFGEVCPDV